MINGVRLAQGRLCGDCVGITVAECTKSTWWIACTGQTLPRSGVRWTQGGQCWDDTKCYNKYREQEAVGAQPL